MLEPFAQELVAQLGDEANYKIVASIYKGEIAVVTVLGAVDERPLGCDLACYSPTKDTSVEEQVSDLLELTLELMAATRNAPTGDVELAMLAAHVHC